MMTGRIIEKIYQYVETLQREDDGVLWCSSSGGQNGAPEIRIGVKTGIDQRHTLTLTMTEIDHQTARPARDLLPPYKDGDLILVHDRPYGRKYHATVTGVHKGGITLPWTIDFESVNTIEPNDSRSYCGSIEVDQDGTSPFIVSERNSQ